MQTIKLIEVKNALVNSLDMSYQDESIRLKWSTTVFGRSTDIPVEFDSDFLYAYQYPEFRELFFNLFADTSVENQNLRFTLDGSVYLFDWSCLQDNFSICVGFSESFVHIMQNSELFKQWFDANYLALFDAYETLPEFGTVCFDIVNDCKNTKII